MRVSGGHLYIAEAPTEPVGETTPPYDIHSIIFYIIFIIVAIFVRKNSQIIQICQMSGGYSLAFSDIISFFFCCFTTIKNIIKASTTQTRSAVGWA